MDLELSNRQAAKIANCSHTAIAEAKKSGHLQGTSDGRVTRAAVQEWMKGRRSPRGNQPTEVAILLADADSPATEAALAALTAAGVFKDRATAELYRDSYIARLRQIEYEREAGKVVEVEHVARVVGESLARVRSRLLAIPSAHAPQIQRCKTVRETESMLRDVIHEALNELVNEASFSND